MFDTILFGQTLLMTWSKDTNFFLLYSFLIIVAAVDNVDAVAVFAAAVQAVVAFLPVVVVAAASIGIVASVAAGESHVVAATAYVVVVA